MTHRGPFQPQLFCDSVIRPASRCSCAGARGEGSPALLTPSPSARRQLEREEEEGAGVPNPIVPENSPPRIFSDRNSVKISLKPLRFLQINFEKVAAKKHLQSYCSQNQIRRKLFTPKQGKQNTIQWLKGSDRLH